MPNITETTDAAASTATAYTLGIGQTGSGFLQQSGDHDWYRVNLVAGQTYTFAVAGEGNTNTAVYDTSLYLRDAFGNYITGFDQGDDGPGTFASLTFTAQQSGTYYIDAGANNDGELGQYGVSAVLGQKALYDQLMGAGSLERPYKTWSTPGQGVTVTWAARTTDANCVDSQNHAAPFTQLTTAEVSLVKTILTRYSDVCGIKFQQVNPGGTSDNATMLFGNYFSNSDGTGAYAQFPTTTAPNDPGGDTRINSNSVDVNNLPQGTYSAFVLMHEVGHAVGLQHPGDYNAGPGVQISYENNAQFIQDSHKYTIMSYFDESSNNAKFDSFPDTPMLYDIAALQQMYGVNTTTRTTNTVYGFGSNAGADYDFRVNTDPAICIWDAGGTDTLNLSGYAQAQKVDLRAGAFSSVGGLVDNVSIAFGAVIENATGGAGNDTITGNSGTNVLNGYLGVDRMYGGAGNDIYYVDNAKDVVGEDPGRGSDTVISSTTYALTKGQEIESLRALSATATTSIGLVGNEFGQSILGNAAGNKIVGLGGVDKLYGNAGNDLLYGGLGNDILEGGLGNDQFVFDTALAGNLDTITDFANASGNNDTIRLDNAIFTKLAATGALNANLFAANATGTAHDGNDYIVYNTATGALFYDSNGNASGGSVQFATLSGHPALTAADFLVI